ncbi:hypothetical protein Ancab_038124 [Ancistrocladus abbreviatus]
MVMRTDKHVEAAKQDAATETRVLCCSSQLLQLLAIKPIEMTALSNNPTLAHVLIMLVKSESLQSHESSRLW